MTPNGNTKHDWKSGNGVPPKAIPYSPANAKVWVPIDRFEKGELALGATDFFEELAGTQTVPFVSIKDTSGVTRKVPLRNDIKTQYNRIHGPGTADDDETKGHAHETGFESSFKSKASGHETISEDDLPIVLEIWNGSGATLYLTKILWKTHNSKAEIAYDLGLGVLFNE